MTPTGLELMLLIGAGVAGAGHELTKALLRRGRHRAAASTIQRRWRDRRGRRVRMVVLRASESSERGGPYA